MANVVLPGKGLKKGPYTTEEDIRTMADVAAEEEVIEREERRLIHSIFEFGDTVVREVMVPRPDMVGVEADAPVDDALEKAIGAGYSRLPAYGEGPDDILGLVYLKDIIRRTRENGDGHGTLRELVRPAVFVPEQKRVAELLREMQQDKFHMAVVIDEYGGTAGLVTLEDLLEEIVGEIVDEYDVEAPRGRAAARRRLAGGRRDPDRRGQRTARSRAAGHRLGHGRRPHVQPPRARPRRRARRSTSRVSSSGPSGSSAGGS